ncbi:hypothetical protein B0H13DRAFT_2312535 [Mycena leptocephala]|nr:hypothetical protein B0H13DRAFT_2312535 [Mycena leptocephala]
MASTASYIAGVLINVVGLARATGRTVPLAATRIYHRSSRASAYLRSRTDSVPGMSRVFDLSKREECDNGLRRMRCIKVKA